MSENVPVARSAKKASDCPCCVAVIHRQPFSSSVSSTTNEAITFLVFIDFPILLLVDSVGFPNPLCPSNRRTCSSFCTMVGRASRAGVWGFPLGCDSFVTAVDARFPCRGYVVGGEPLPASHTNHIKRLPKYADIIITAEATSLI